MTTGGIQTHAKCFISYFSFTALTRQVQALNILKYLSFSYSSFVIFLPQMEYNWITWHSPCIGLKPCQLLVCVVHCSTSGFRGELKYLFTATLQLELNEAYWRLNEKINHKEMIICWFSDVSLCVYK